MKVDLSRIYELSRAREFLRSGRVVPLWVECEWEWLSLERFGDVPDRLRGTKRQVLTLKLPPWLKLGKLDLADTAKLSFAFELPISGITMTVDERDSRLTFEALTVVKDQSDGIGAAGLALLPGVFDELGSGELQLHQAIVLGVAIFPKPDSPNWETWFAKQLNSELPSDGYLTPAQVIAKRQHSQLPPPTVPEDESVDAQMLKVLERVAIAVEANTATLERLDREAKERAEEAGRMLARR